MHTDAMSTPKRYLTTVDIARAAGVNQSTVSRALRNDRQISRAVAERIQALAREMGYRPDPYLSALTAHVRVHRRKPHPATIVLLRCSSDVPLCDDLYATGATVRADELGYSVSGIDFLQPSMTPARLGTILRARGIDGLLVLPVESNVHFDDLDFSEIAAATVDLTLHEPCLHRAVPDYFGQMRLALGQLDLAGFRRVLLCDTAQEHALFDATWFGAFLAWQQEHPIRQRLPTFTTHDFNQEAFVAWYTRWKPDAIISNNYCFAEWLIKRGVRIPEDVVFASLSVDGDHPRCPGIDQQPGEVGKLAVDLIVEQLQRNERGLPASRKTVLVPGRWLGGVWRLDATAPHPQQRADTKTPKR